ncbi:hypothetical protein X474_01280 [Dethiosulfatarculus sandiegensis]|uniref:Uncharacterized protein n=1 Tax=Dethiosulfatarculus sandiegensis TaxID=1429043 RepID=A0A0D2JD31_9BACT|nr:hypothetical protein X474_01280 [Dethiosulfatarculus sandiegensis]
MAAPDLLAWNIHTKLTLKIGPLDLAYGVQKQQFPDHRP